MVVLKKNPKPKIETLTEVEELDSFAKANGIDRNSIKKTVNDLGEILLIDASDSKIVNYAKNILNMSENAVSAGPPSMSTLPSQSQELEEEDLTPAFEKIQSLENQIMELEKQASETKASENIPDETVPDNISEMINEIAKSQIDEIKNELEILRNESKPPAKKPGLIQRFLKRIGV